MEQFFRDTISNLPALGGVNQEQKLDGKMSALVKELVSVCDEFSFGKHMKKKVILDGIRKDKEFYGLNGRGRECWETSRRCGWGRARYGKQRTQTEDDEPHRHRSHDDNGSKMA